MSRRGACVWGRSEFVWLLNITGREVRAAVGRALPPKATCYSARIIGRRRASTTGASRMPARTELAGLVSGRANSDIARRSGCARIGTSRMT
jgi:hypothetical protein